MMKNIIFIATVQMMMLTSCLLSSKDYPNGSNDDATASDTPVQFTEVSLISDIDEYVSDIRENIEEASITKQQLDGKQKVVFVKDNDTVKISVMADSSNITTTDIYFQDSKPIFVSSNIIFDVDSSYLETAYFKDGEPYKLFRNGNEISTRAYASSIMRRIGR